MNLKEETLGILNEYGRTKDDIVWIGCPSAKIPIDLFWELADIEYNNGFGAQYVADDLVVVGNGWWLERCEYDGSEWWEYKEPIKEPTKTVTVSRLTGIYGGNLLWMQNNFAPLNTQSEE